jgi:hypothetical protein
MSSSPSNTVAAPKKRRPEPIGLRADFNPATHEGLRFYPASASDADRIKAKGVRGNDLVFVDFRKPRNSGFHRLAHAIGRMVVENVEEFSHMTPHEALKRLQMEAGAGCELCAVDINTIWLEVMAWIRENLGHSFAEVLMISLKAIGVKSRMIAIRIPKSMSYDVMDQGEFHETVTTICKYIAKRYWTSMSAEDIEEMANAAGRMLE